MRDRPELLARGALGAAVLAPMAIWILADGRLARPTEVAGWALLVALWAACCPPRFLRPVAWVQLLALPLTAGWTGSVALTGAGPSVASTASISAGAMREVFTAAKMAFHVPTVLVVLALTLALSVFAVRATGVQGGRWRPALACVFLGCTLGLGATMASTYPTIAQLASAEARVSVPWLSHLAVAKEEADFALERLAMTPTKEVPPRQAAAAPRLFDMAPGLAVFVVGESLRADALIQPQRGPWSRALADRLGKGLGVRLPDACSGSNATFISVPRLLAAVDPADYDGAARKPTLLALARAAGAVTAYINNQEVWVVPELGHDFMLKTASLERNPYDEAVVAALGDYLARTRSPRQAVLLHLYGEHAEYQDRYPADMFGPEPAGLDAGALSELRYQRAAENGARVLVEAAALLDKTDQPAYLVFTSDHGENLPSDRTGKLMHAGQWVGKFDTTVPALVLWNRAFAASGRAERLRPLVQAPGLLAHRDVARAWLALAGMPDTLAPTAEPRTFGQMQDRPSASPVVACAQLAP